MCAVYGCDLSETTKSVTKGVVGGTIEVTKGAMDGLKSGIEEGRKEATSTDGSQVLSTADEIFDTVHITVLEVAAGEGSTTVTLGFENTAETAVHLIGLDGNGGALLIDGDGFSTGLTLGNKGQSTGAIKLPPKAKTKQSLLFQGAPKTVAGVRLWGKDIAAN